MRKVRAKMHCISSRDIHGHNFVQLEPVFTGSEENSEYWKYTPSGVVTLSGVSGEVSTFFVPGKEYFVDFVLANAEIENKT